MDNPRIRFWIACITAAIVSYVTTVYATNLAAYVIFFVFFAALFWVIAAHAKRSGGLGRLPRSRAMVISAGTTLALLFFCALGAFLGIGKLTGFQD